MKNLTFLVLLLFISCQENTSQQRNSGAVFGTTYTIIYDSSENFQDEFNQIFDDINRSMSTYIPNSIISNVNRNRTTKIDSVQNCF